MRSVAGARALTTPGLWVVLANAAWAQAPPHPLSTAQAVLARYQDALGGAPAIRQVQAVTTRGEIERSGVAGKVIFVSYAKPFESVFIVTRPNGTQSRRGFDGAVSWTIAPAAASIDSSTPLQSNRRDADLQYALHQPDYFRSLDLVGVEKFEGRPCYHLHGVTLWGKDNNQFYDVQTGLLAGYRFQSDDASSQPVVVVFSEYKRFGALLEPTRQTARTAHDTTTFKLMSISYDPIPDSLFEMPSSVRALIKR